MFRFDTTTQLYSFRVVYIPILISFNANSPAWALDNGFVLPPHSVRNVPVDNSPIVFVLGENITLEWTTNYVEPMSLYQYQWQNRRDASGNYYATTLLGSYIY